MLHIFLKKCKSIRQQFCSNDLFFSFFKCCQEWLFPEIKNLSGTFYPLSSSNFTRLRIHFDGSLYHFRPITRKWMFALKVTNNKMDYQQWKAFNPQKSRPTMKEIPRHWEIVSSLQLTASLWCNVSVGSAQKRVKDSWLSFDYDLLLFKRPIKVLLYCWSYINFFALTCIRFESR